MKKMILIIPLFVIGAVGAHAQSVGPATLNAAGGTTIISSNEFDWSVGEMTMITTLSTPSVIVTQGVLQPAEITLGVATASSLKDQLHVFPNPATSLVNLQYSAASEGVLTYHLMDVGGRVVASKAMTLKKGANLNQVDLSNLAAATYLLEVTVTGSDGATNNISYKIDKLK